MCRMTYDTDEFRRKERADRLAYTQAHPYNWERARVQLLAEQVQEAMASLPTNEKLLTDLLLSIFPA